MKKISELMDERFAVSFEVFPPKTEKGMEKMPDTLDHLYKYRPDYISCTYGAGGSNVGKNLEVLGMIRDAGNGTIPVTHFTCIGQTRTQAKERLQNYLDNGIEHVLALRGDIPVGASGTNGDFRYATDLVAFIRKEFGDSFEIAVSGLPEGHIESSDIKEDIAHLRQKQDEGADYIMTQLTYDMEQFKRWLDAIRTAGIYLPVDAGVMPVLSKDAVINQCFSRNGCAIPGDLARLLSHNWFDKDPDGNIRPEVREAFKEEGKEYTVKQIHEYMALGVDGIHLYALNKWEDVSDILDRAGIRTLI
ncbi:MAG: methylenetetrahydrofolate reductase [Eubacterium sp.]|nr:methylenetetrahydrofolate reductase [Eubacterium sp.]